MLVLSRHTDEAIMIGEDVEIVVVDIRGDKVRLGVNAPPRIAVHRKEIFEAIREENAHAATLRSALGISGGGGHALNAASGRLRAGAGTFATIRSIAAGRVSA